MKVVIMEVQRVPLERINKYACWMEETQMIIGHGFSFAEACKLITMHMRTSHPADKKYKLIIQHETDEPRKV